MIGGTVHVNEHVIATWRAWRTDARKTDDVNTYCCAVTYEGQDGYHYTAEFVIEHNYGDGGLALAGAVLNEAPKHLRRDNSHLDRDSITAHHFARLLE